jgi:hypothetical protein
MPTLYVAPSSLSFLAAECERCYYLDAHQMRKRPRTPFPAIFSQIDSAMKGHLARGAHVLDPDLPAMKVMSQGCRVVSRPLAIESSDIEIVVRGYYDSLVCFGDGELSVVDWKTTRIRPELVNKYGRSLHAYAYAIEHPALGQPCKIGRLGLGVFEPDSFTLSDGGAARLDGSFHWVDIPRDDDAFRASLYRLGVLLAGPLPQPDANCGFCSYAEVA